MTEGGGVSIHPVEQQVSQIPLGELIPVEHVAKPKELMDSAHHDDESMQIEDMGSSEVEAMRRELVSANEYESGVKDNVRLGATSAKRQLTRRTRYAFMNYLCCDKPPSRK